MQYNAFLSYNSKNRPVVKTIHEYLTNFGLRIFFDHADIDPGVRFQPKIESALKESAAILVVIGPDGVGPWQEHENYAFQLIDVGGAGGAGKPVIPVVLPGAAFGPKVEGIPAFLNQYNALTFESSVDNKDDLFRLMRAIPRGVNDLGPLERPFLRDEQQRLLDRTIDFYNREAGRYHERWKDALPLPPMYAFLQHVRRFPGRQRVLDAGCGPGHHSNFFAMEGCDVEGIDASLPMIQIAESNKVQGTHFSVADMRDLQRVFKARNMFDGLWACASCFHITKEAFGNQLQEFLAVLKPSGVLGLSMQVGVPSAIQDDGRFFERYEEDDLLNKVARYGFDVVNMNVQITDRNTMRKKQIKRWLNITALAPTAKERIDLLGKLDSQNRPPEGLGSGLT